MLFILYINNNIISSYYSQNNNKLSRCRVGIRVGATAFKMESVGVFLTPTDKDRASACTLLPPISKQM